MAFLPSTTGSYLTQSQIEALTDAFGEEQFIQLLALSTHAAGSYLTRHLFLEYAHTMRTLEEMNHSLSPDARETLRRMQEQYSAFSRDNLAQAYEQLLMRFNEIIADPTAGRAKHSRFHQVTADLIEGFTWGHVGAKKLLK